MHKTNRHQTQGAGPLNPPANQTGSVLIISLLILIVMTLLSVTSMTTTTVQEKMAGNTRDQGIAFQSAEAALRNAETDIEGLATVNVFNGTNGLYARDTEVNPFSNATWNNSRLYTGPLSDAKTAPRYVIELSNVGTGDPLNVGNYGENSGAASVNTFRITARATGKTDGSYIYLQEHYGRAM